MQFLTFVLIVLVGGFLFVLYSTVSIMISRPWPGVDQELGKFKFQTNLDPKTRSERFPSVEDRVKLYMSDWHLPPCSDADKLSYAKEKNGNYTNNSCQCPWAQLRFLRRYSTKPSPLSRSSHSLTIAQVVSQILVLKTITFQRPHAGLVDNRRNQRPVCADLEELLPLKPSLATLGVDENNNNNLIQSIPVPMFGPSRECQPCFFQSFNVAIVLDEECSRPLLAHTLATAQSPPVRYDCTCESSRSSAVGRKISKSNLAWLGS
jgi:hypothetical protein